MTYSIIKAIAKTVKFAESIEVDGFLLPDGEFRVGKKSASKTLGFQEDYLSRLPKKSVKQFKALLDEGYTDSPKTIEYDFGRGATRSETISLDDFTSFIFFAAMRGKKEAIAIQKAITRVGIEDWFRLTFNIERQSLEEKRALFYQDYAKTINWLNEDQIDWKLIEEQELFSALN